MLDIYYQNHVFNKMNINNLPNISILIAVTIFRKPKSDKFLKVFTVLT